MRVRYKGAKYDHGGSHDEPLYYDSEGNPIYETISGVAESALEKGQELYNDWRGVPGIPAQERETSNPLYSGMNEVVDWMQEQERSGRGRVGSEGEGESHVSSVDVLERIRQPEETTNPNVPSYDPAPSPHDIEKKAMMFSNVFDVVRSNIFKGIDDSGVRGGDLTEEKRERISKVLEEQEVPEEWQNEFFEALRMMRPGMTQGGYSGEGMREMEGQQAGTIDSPRTSQSLQISQSPIQLPETQRRGIFRRNR